MVLWLWKTGEQLDQIPGFSTDFGAKSRKEKTAYAWVSLMLWLDIILTMPFTDLQPWFICTTEKNIGRKTRQYECLHFYLCDQTTLLCLYQSHGRIGSPAFWLMDLNGRSGWSRGWWVVTMQYKPNHVHSVQISTLGNKWWSNPDIHSDIT